VNLHVNFLLVYALKLHNDTTRVMLHKHSIISIVVGTRKVKG